MKKQRRKLNLKPKKYSKDQNTNAVKANTYDRRNVLKHLRNGAFAAMVLGGGGYFATSKVRASIAEQDLSKIGNGTPAVVQIHDPQCPVCIALQKEARHALRNFEDGELEYLVANIKNKKGSELANKYFVPHVTLLLFDGGGTLVKILNGSNNSDFLRNEFAAHIAVSKQD